MLEMDYDEEEIHELFKEDGREEERTNTERERKRADEVEAKVKELEASLLRWDNNSNQKNQTPDVKYMIVVLYIGSF